MSTENQNIDVSKLSYRQLQAQCKKFGLSARGKTAQLRELLTDYLEKESKEEEKQEEEIKKEEKEEETKEKQEEEIKKEEKIDKKQDEQPQKIFTEKQKAKQSEGEDETDTKTEEQQEKMDLESKPKEIKKKEKDEELKEKKEEQKKDNGEEEKKKQENETKTKTEEQPEKMDLEPKSDKKNEKEKEKEKEQEKEHEKEQEQEQEQEKEQTNQEKKSKSTKDNKQIINEILSSSTNISKDIKENNKMEIEKKKIINLNSNKHSNSKRRRLLGNKMDSKEKKTEKKRLVPKSKKPSSRAILIKNLTRPLRKTELHKLLDQNGKVLKFWISRIMTHCYVLYETIEQAEKARNNLYGVVFPAKGKSLYVVFVNEKEAETYFDDSQPVSKSSNIISLGSKKEVAKNKRFQSGKEKENGNGNGNGNGKEKDREQENEKKIEKEPKSLDELFNKTKANPYIYYQPVSETIVNKRRETILKQEKKLAMERNSYKDRK
ncbi:sap DNA-binding domain-containing protein [Anaeramoeba flamelloides]|uniref:Sap DNA-binding domain-containing protein n=1 Tax=Anaeramoeba flamelloides TaxID=1746091 RepID=A0ABQ8XKC2_9EUKA|nr:sap DNA-binding domain-containing protein [Anaeramoeba flamelloides]